MRDGERRSVTKGRHMIVCAEWAPMRRQAGWHRRNEILSQQAVAGQGFCISPDSAERRNGQSRKDKSKQFGVRNVKTKIVILGAGHVGSHVARALASGGIADEVVLVDKVPGKAAAQAMDVADALSFPPSDTAIRAGGYRDIEDADITVLSIGKAREPGQTRLDLLADSVRMVDELVRSLGGIRPGGLLVSITNPCDIIADQIRSRLSMDRTHAFGTGTLLDTARLIRVMSEQTGMERHAIGALVLGEHGDSSMIPFSALRVNGLPAEEAPGFDREAALERTHQIGMDIIEGKGSTEFGIGQATAHLCRAILTDSHEILPLSVQLRGEYGLSGIHCGVPCRVGRSGIEEILEIPLTEEERQALLRSAQVLEKHTRMAAQIAAESEK